MAETKKVSAPSRAENARYVVEQMRILGVPPVVGSRIMVMHDILQRGSTDYDAPDFPIALESDRDLVQLGFILAQLESSRREARFRQLCKDLLRDSTLPQNDLVNSQGRDSQFELYLAAVCQKAGMTPVGYHEPDVTCHVDGTMMSIAAKRIKSQKQSRARIKKAIEQIKFAGRPGIVALEMSIAWNRKNLAVLSPLEKLRHDLQADERAHKFFVHHEPAIIAQGEGKGLLGVVAFQFIPYVMADGSWRQQRSAWWLEIGNNEDPARLYYQFYQRFIDVIPNLDDLPVAK
jgi:hypothetical protein